MFHVIERQYVGINIERVSRPVLIYTCAEQDVPNLSRRDDKYLYIDHGQYKSATRAVIEARKLAEKKSNDDNKGCHLVNDTDFAIDHMAVDYRVFAPENTNLLSTVKLLKFWVQKQLILWKMCRPWNRLYLKLAKMCFTS